MDSSLITTCPCCGHTKRARKLPQVQVIIRKHPLGIHQPTGKRQVRAMYFEGKGRHKMLFVGIQYNNGIGGWAFKVNEHIDWLTFNVGGSSRPQSLKTAWEYWNEDLIARG